MSAAAANRLDGIARGFAKANGDARPAWINAVITTHARALASATPGDSEAAGARSDVYLITMRGHFTGHMASVPPGAKLPTGSYISIVINARTFMVMDWGLSPGRPARVAGQPRPGAEPARLSHPPPGHACRLRRTVPMRASGPPVP